MGPSAIVHSSMSFLGHPACFTLLDMDDSPTTAGASGVFPNRPTIERAPRFCNRKWPRFGAQKTGPGVRGFSFTVALIVAIFRAPKMEPLHRVFFSAGGAEVLRGNFDVAGAGQPPPSRPKGGTRSWNRTCAVLTLRLSRAHDAQSRTHIHTAMSDNLSSLLLACLAQVGVTTNSPEGCPAYKEHRTQTNDQSQTTKQTRVSQ